jgi:hypothetical protein
MSDAPNDQRLADAAEIAQQCMALGGVILAPKQAAGFSTDAKPAPQGRPAPRSAADR